MKISISSYAMIHILCKFCFWFISVFCMFMEDVSKLLALLRSMLLIQRVTDCYRTETLLFKSTIVSDCAVLGTSFRGTIHYTSNLLPPARLKQCQVCVVAAQLVHQNCFCARCNNNQMDEWSCGFVLCCVFTDRDYAVLHLVMWPITSLRVPLLHRIPWSRI